MTHDSQALRKPTFRRPGCASSAALSIAASHHAVGLVPRWQAHQAGGRTRDSFSSAWACLAASSEETQVALDPAGSEKLGPSGSRNSSSRGRI